MADRSGQQLGNYRLQRLLGRGGFAEVYLGEHTYLHKPAALKLLHIRLDEHEIKQFLREAQTLAWLDHPHIVRVLDFAVQDGLPYLVMDYATGGILRTKHPIGTRVPLEQVLSYVSQIASALQYAHDKHLIHRDIKPENMLLDADQQVLLADFGLALLTHTHSGSTQATNPAMAGTALYLAPEQIQGQPCPASDQYALAVVVYEWLSGQRLFQGTPIEVAMQHVSAVPSPLHEQLPDLSPEVEQVVMRALAKTPEQRFPSVQDFANALQYAAQPASDAYITSAVPMTSAATPGERTAPEAFWKVPTSLTPLIGREQDVSSVCTMLSRPEVRLLTLLGVGGIGKTRLSIQVASQLRDHFADGVCFVGLAPISDPSLVFSSIAHELALQEAGARPLVETVTAWLRDRQFFLLLDNFEQIVSTALLLEDLLVACPRLVILVTSREVLHLSAEHLFPVPPLSLPDLTQFPDHEQLSQYAAVSLFLQRAQALKPDFTLTQANARAIAEICVRLEGLPLAIELAAARIRVLPPQALLARLTQRFGVLTSGSRTLPERQQTLRNTIQWSYDLLNEQEQRLIRRLSVFVGGCTLEAAEAVCVTGSEASEGRETSVLDVIASLIDKSLLQHRELEGEEPRLVMLEMIREFGLEALATSGEAEIIQRGHAYYYLQLSEETEPRLIGALNRRRLERLQQEHENVRAAHAWLLEHNEQEGALRLGVALWRFWWMHGHLSEGRRELAQALAGSRGNVATAVRVKAIFAAGALADRQGDFEQAQALCGESLTVFRELGDPRGCALSLTILGDAARERSDYAMAHALLEEAITLFREVNDTYDITLALVCLAVLFLSQGEYVQARTLVEEAAQIDRRGGDSWKIATSLWVLALVMFFQGDLTGAQPLVEESLTLSRREGYKTGIAWALYISGCVAALQGDVAAARVQFDESLTLFKELGDRLNIANVLGNLAWLSFLQGDYARARALLEESFVLFKAVGNKWFIAGCLVGFAALAAAQGKWRWAVRLAGASEALRQAIKGVLSPSMRVIQESTLTAARAQLGEEAFTAAWAEGRTMTPDQALAAQEPVTMPTTAPAEPPSAPKAPTYPAGLTSREVEVLRLVAQGLTDAQVAEQLVISPRTVNFHLTSIYSKLQVSSRTAATRYAMEQGLI